MTACTSMRYTRSISWRTTNPRATHPHHLPRTWVRGRYSLEGEGGYGGHSGADTERLQGIVKSVGGAFAGGWKCGWGSCWAMGMRLG